MPLFSGTCWFFLFAGEEDTSGKPPHFIKMKIVYPILVITLNNTRDRLKIQAYFINSNSPSGGTKLTVFSELNLVKFTH